MAGDHRFSLSLDEQESNRINRQFPNWGDKSDFFKKIIFQIIEEIEEHGSFVIHSVRAGRAKAVIQFDPDYIMNLQGLSNEARQTEDETREDEV